MNYLREFDITDDVIENIKNYNAEAVVQNLIYDEINVKEVIEFFKSINIDVISELLISRPEIFTISSDKIKKGSAKILTVISDNKVEEFDINIIRINKNSKSRNYI